MNASPFWIMLLLSSGAYEHRMIDRGRYDPTSKIVLSPDDPLAKASKNTARVKK
jgi:hypothetical protein